MKTILLTSAIITLVLSILVGTNVIKCKRSLLVAWLSLLVGAMLFVIVLLNPSYS